MQYLTFQQANAIIELLPNNMASQKVEFLNLIVNLNHQEPPSAPTPVLTPSPSANCATTDATKLAIVEAIKDLKETCKPVKRNGVPHNNRLKHYCWTHVVRGKKGS